MAATNKTTPFNLSQFVGGDRIKRLDYNADMLNINEALKKALLTATPDKPGQVKIGANIKVASDGTISVANTYVLPTASSSVLGGVKIGDNINISNGTISTHGLSNSVDSTSSTTGASSAAVRSAFKKGSDALNKASAMLPKSGGTMTGDINLGRHLITGAGGVGINMGHPNEMNFICPSNTLHLGYRQIGDVKVNNYRFGDGTASVSGGVNGIIQCKDVIADGINLKNKIDEMLKWKKVASSITTSYTIQTAYSEVRIIPIYAPNLTPPRADFPVILGPNEDFGFSRTTEYDFEKIGNTITVNDRGDQHDLVLDIYIR